MFSLEYSNKICSRVTSNVTPKVFSTKRSVFKRSVVKKISYLSALLYLRFALWWLDLNLQGGPDALKDGFSVGLLIMSSLFNKLNTEIF